MAGQLSLPLATTKLDVRRFVKFHPDPFGSRWLVGPGDGRAGQLGRSLGTIALKHAGGYEVVLELDSGKIDSFSPMQLFPAGDEP